MYRIVSVSSCLPSSEPALRAEDGVPFVAASTACTIFR